MSSQPADDASSRSSSRPSLSTSISNHSLDPISISTSSPSTSTHPLPPSPTSQPTPKISRIIEIEPISFLFRPSPSSSSPSPSPPTRPLLAPLPPMYRFPSSSSSSSSILVPIRPLPPLPTKRARTLPQSTRTRTSMLPRSPNPVGEWPIGKQPSGLPNPSPILNPEIHSLHVLPYVQPTTLLSRVLSWLDLPLSSSSSSHPSSSSSTGVPTKTETRTTLLWLNGPTHTGKTLLAHRIADVCKTKPTGVVVLSYFFARDEGGGYGRKGGGVEECLVMSLVEQLCANFPGVRALIDRAQVDNPDIFAEPLHTQLQALLFAPFMLLHESHFSHTTRSSSPRIEPTSASTPLPRLLLIIDALDAHPSAHSQVSLLYSLSYLLSTSATREVPLLVIITSRRERHLKSAFCGPRVTPLLFTISLDRHRLPTRDIRVFLCASFTQLKNTRDANQPTGDWPGDEVLDEIIARSERGYLFPSLLIHHLLLSANPVHEVDTILQSHVQSTLQRPPRPPPESTPPTTSNPNPSANATPAPPTPTAHVDSLLSHIFASVSSSDIRNVLTILSYVLLGKTTNPGLICEFFGMDIGRLEGMLEGLKSLVSISSSSSNPNTSSSKVSDTQSNTTKSNENTTHPISPPSQSSNSNKTTKRPNIHFVHPCVEQFLMDRTRSGVYHISSQEFANRLVGVWVRRVSGSSGCMLSDWGIISILRLLSHAKPTAELAHDLNAFQPAKIQDLVHASFFPSFLAGVEALDFKDGGTTHTYHLHLIIPLLRKHAPQYLAEFAKQHPLVMGIEENARLQPNRRSQAPPRYSPAAQPPHPSPTPPKSKSKPTPNAKPNATSTTNAPKPTSIPKSHPKASTKTYPEPEPDPDRDHDPDPDAYLKPGADNPKKLLKDLTSRMTSNFTGSLNLKSHFNLSQVSLGSFRSRRVSQVGREG